MLRYDSKQRMTWSELY